MTDFVRLDLSMEGVVYVNPAAVAKIDPWGKDESVLVYFGANVPLSDVVRGSPAKVAHLLSRKKGVVP